MIEITQKKDCAGCYACANICPLSCIDMIEDKEGFLYPKVDNIKCKACGLCEKVCPIINKKERVNDTVACACINKNEYVRSESSSGGIFTLLAEAVINNGGIVFGAAFDENLNLVHGNTGSIEGLSKFRGSKYLQSKIGDSYKQVKGFLNKGTKVLFTGTPCQISGLVSYLGKDYDNLICIDIICHGVPSPRVFNMYRTEHEKVNGATICDIDFRYKNLGWKNYSIRILFDNNREYRKEFKKDIFMRGFLQNLYLRPSCYKCKYKNLNRLSDITVADFWGIENIAPELDDNKGTSLVLVNSGKGKKIFQQLKDKMIDKEIDVQQAIKYNSAAIKSIEYNINRDKFFNEMNLYSLNISELIKKYTKDSLVRKVYRKVSEILH